jgi:hypothetical protein
MATLDIPQGLVDQHAAWHMNNMPGASQYGSNVEFLRFHCSVLGRIQVWMDSQFNWVELREQTKPWEHIPDDLKTKAAGDTIYQRFHDQFPNTFPTPESAQWQGEDLEQRLSNQPTTFADDDDLASAISNTGFHGWVHLAVAAVYHDDNMADSMVSPRSTYFSQWHGLINNWWQSWKVTRQPGATYGCVSLSGPTEQVVAVDTTVTVHESDHDVDTGVDVRGKDLLFVEADGQIYAGVPLTGSNWPKGWDNIDNDPKFPYHTGNDAHPYSLIGKLGPSSPYFYIGALKGPWQPLDRGAQAQRLFLRTNDDIPGNGSGAFTCHIIIWR